MYRILLSTLLILSGVSGYAQTQSAYNRVKWNQLLEISSEFKKTQVVSATTESQFPVYNIKGDWYVSIYGKAVSSINMQTVSQHKIMLGSRVGDILTMKVPLEQFAAIDFSQLYTYVEIPGKIIPLLDRAVKDTHADSVQHGWNLPEAFTGKDVMIGITDWGFDYGHPMYYDTLLTTSRVAAAWDQYKQSGNQPNGFNYGVEYDTPAELVAGESDTANIYSYHTHGSHVAGITGGSGAGTTYRGFAFESQFLFATFLVDQASVIDAFVWMRDKANAAGKRLVVNMSWGLYYNQMGSLDGYSLLSQVFDQMSADDNVVFVASAGNNGSVNYHIKNTFNNNSFSSRISFYDYSANPNMWGECITMWGEENHPFSAQINVYNASNNLLVSSPFYSTLTTTTYLDSILVAGNDTLLFNVIAETANPLNNKPGMQLRVNCTNTNLKVVLTSAAADGTVHYWNVAELTNGVGNFGQTFTAFGANGKTGDANYSVGEPACANSVIAVAAYSSGYINGQGNPAGGSRASFSSIGPLHNETMKPDISAPGVSVASSISSYTDASYSALETINFNGKDYDFARFSGTSMASPCVSGIVALMLDASPTLSPAQVKDIIKSTARLDNYTGTITAPGDTKWGMGKINAYQAVVLALNTVSIDEFKSNQWMALYPNPAQETVYLLFPENAEIGTVQLITIDGKTIPVNATQDPAIDLTTIASGVYTIVAEVNGTMISKRFVKE